MRKKWPTLDERKAPITKSQQQDGGEIMIWAGIVGNKPNGPFKVDNCVRMTSET